jgi:ferredoxin
MQKAALARRWSMIVIDRLRCTGCGICLTVCPQDAVVLEAERAEIKEELCNGCGACLSACPEGAIMDVEPAPLTAPSPARPETVVSMVPSAPTEPVPTRVRPVKVVRSSPPEFERRLAVAGTAMSVGPIALRLLARLAERRLRRGDLPNLMERLH